MSDEKVEFKKELLENTEFLTKEEIINRLPDDIDDLTREYLMYNYEQESDFMFCVIVNGLILDGKLTLKPKE